VGDPPVSHRRQETCRLSKSRFSVTVDIGMVAILQRSAMGYERNATAFQVSDTFVIPVRAHDEHGIRPLAVHEAR
jgi:hypothetical protein